MIAASKRPVTTSILIPSRHLHLRGENSLTLPIRSSALPPGSCHRAGTPATISCRALTLYLRSNAARMSFTGIAIVSFAFNRRSAHRFDGFTVGIHYQTWQNFHFAVKWPFIIIHYLLLFSPRFVILSSILSSTKWRKYPLELSSFCAFYFIISNIIFNIDENIFFKFIERIINRLIPKFLIL